MEQPPAAITSYWQREAQLYCSAKKNMAIGKSQFTGAAGQYFVSYALSVRGIHASLTLGNAPGVDLLAADSEGRNALSIQVKTSRNAYRTKRYGREGHEWDVGACAVGKHTPNLWYALVDLRESESGFSPEVFIVPSLWVGEFVKPDFSRKIYFLPTTADELARERWDHLQRFLDGDADVTHFATTWPEDRLVRWGQPPAEQTHPPDA